MTSTIDTISRTRTFGIIAHVDAGKTTVTERLLYVTGATHKKGEVHHGTTVTDHHHLERQKGITISSAAVRCQWQGHALNLVDTPGHVDFAIEVERALRVLDGAVVVLDAVAGVEPQTESVWRRAVRHGVPRIVFVNKLDRAGASLEQCVDALSSRLGARALVLCLPVVDDGGVVGVIDLVGMQWLRLGGGGAGAVDDEHVAVARDARRALVLAVADVDDEVLAAVVGDDGAVDDIDDVSLWRALRRVTLSQVAIPVLGGAALADLGIELLLDAIVALLPSPLDRVVDGVDSVDGDGPALGLAFKVVHDAFGATTLVRIYDGVLRKGASVVSARTGRRCRVGRLVQPFAGRVSDVDSAVAGDIVGIVGATFALGDTLTGEGRSSVALITIEVPPPVVSVAVTPNTRRDREGLATALSRLMAEDPSIISSTDAETGETLVSGQGELHLEVTLAKLHDDHGVAVASSAPRVAHKATVTRSVEHGLTWRKQSGGPGQYAQVRLRVGPAPSGAGLVFADLTRGGAVPAAFAAAVKTGVLEAMARGAVFDVPLVDVSVELIDGAIHSQDSSELAFHLAARACFLEAVVDAGVVLLEPMAAVEVSVAGEYVGDVSGDLVRRRGQMTGIALGDDGRATVTATVPVAALFGYATALRSMTQGRASFSQAPAGLAVVPDAIAQAHRA